MPYGPAELSILVVETFAEVQAEYAAIRKGCVLLDLPQRGCLRTEGDDRLGFLNRMVTQELKDLTPSRAVRSFWLNRKGRIDADLRIIALEDHFLIDLDVLVASTARDTLDNFLFSEDCRIEDMSETTHRLALHGPTAPNLLRAVASPSGGEHPADLAPGRASVASIAGKRVVIDRQDSAGEPGFEILTSVEDTKPVYDALLEAGLDDNGSSETIRLRQAGWLAYNIARIEAGWPIYNIDFGPQSLPHETGVLHDRVSFTKGCYLGQEVVARMQSLGRPKQKLVGLRIATAPQSEQPVRQPLTGALVYTGAEDSPEPVGAVTSSTLSPMLGGEAICFAQVRTKHADAGTRLLTDADGSRVPATVQDSLVFWSREKRDA